MCDGQTEEQTDGGLSYSYSGLVVAKKLFKKMCIFLLKMMHIKFIVSIIICIFVQTSIGIYSFWKVSNLQ